MSLKKMPNSIKDWHDAMRNLSIAEVLTLHRLVIARSGGSAGLRDPNALDSAVAQPRMTFGGADLYPTLIEKAAALAFSMVLNHPFVDGNKRIGHAAMETFLLLNGSEIEAEVDEQERVFLSLAAGDFKRDAFNAWVRSKIVARRSG